jgi:hypothetical protein
MKDLHQARKSLLPITDRVFRLPLVSTPVEEGVDGAPGFFLALAMAIVSAPDGISKADQGVDELETGDETAVFVIR